MYQFNRQDLRLAANLWKMAVRDRYLGSSLGSFWAVANPLFMLTLATFVFGFVFKVRLPGAESTLEYVIWLIVGYGPWIATTEAIMAATTSVVGAAGVVKNMAFKTELLPISATFIGLISLTVSLCFLLALSVVSGKSPDWHVLWLPVIVALQFFLLAALGLWLSATNVFLRDLSIGLPNILTIIMFITPIFYPLESLPPLLQSLSFANPFYLLIDAYRGVLLRQDSPSPVALAYLLLLAFVIFHFGLAAFRRAKGQFNSAL
jgi:lipopolysaccharide transport system permease protein